MRNDTTNRCIYNNQYIFAVWKTNEWKLFQLLNGNISFKVFIHFLQILVGKNIQSFCLFFQVCHGKGSSREASQTDAARRALVLLADSGDNMSAENDYAVGSKRSANDNALLSKGNRIENQTMETGDVSRRGATLNSRGGDSILNGSKKSIESSSIPIVSAAVVSTTANSAHIGSGTQSAKAAAKSAASCNDDKQE